MDRNQKLDWTPVSEGWPDSDGEYYITGLDEDSDTYVELAIWDNWEKNFFDFDYVYFVFEDLKRVIAWKPHIYPEPYKE